MLPKMKLVLISLGLAALLAGCGRASNISKEPEQTSSQWGEESFLAMFKRTSAEQPDVRNRQMNVLNERYDLSDRPSSTTKMSRGKPVQAGVRVKLPAGVSWEQLSAMSPEDIRAKGLFPAGFLPLPHPKNVEGGMVFP